MSINKIIHHVGFLELKSAIKVQKACSGRPISDPSTAFLSVFSPIQQPLCKYNEFSKYALISSYGRICSFCLLKADYMVRSGYEKHVLKARIAGWEPPKDC
jgi:hypothetical protein